jgi:hypothetical protein
VINSNLNGVVSEQNEAANFYNALFSSDVREKISIHPNLASIEGLDSNVEQYGRKDVKFKISNATYLKGRVKDVKVY